MPKSKRNKEVSLTKKKKNTFELKNRLIEEVQSCIDKYENIFVFSVNNMRNNKLKKVRENWKNSRLLFGKIRIMALALGRGLEEEYKPNLHKLSKHLNGQCGLFFSNESKNKIINWFNSYSESDFARSGNVATYSVTVPEGPLPQFPHSLEPHLRQLGMPTTLKKGVVCLIKNYEICKEGDTLTPETASILKLLGYEMAEFHITLECVWSKDGSFMKLSDNSPDKENMEIELSSKEESDIEVDQENIIDSNVETVSKSPITTDTEKICDSAPVDDMEKLAIFQKKSMGTENQIVALLGSEDEGKEAESLVSKEKKSVDTEHQVVPLPGGEDEGKEEESFVSKEKESMDTEHQVSLSGSEGEGKEKSLVSKERNSMDTEHQVVSLAGGEDESKEENSVSKEKKSMNTENQVVLLPGGEDEGKEENSVSKEKKSVGIENQVVLLSGSEAKVKESSVSKIEESGVTQKETVEIIPSTKQELDASQVGCQKVDEQEEVLLKDETKKIAKERKFVEPEKVTPKSKDELKRKTPSSENQLSKKACVSSPEISPLVRTLRNRTVKVERKKIKK